MKPWRSILALVVTAVALAAASCGDDIATAGQAPGYSDAEEGVESTEDDPFELVRPPGGDGPTTIPGPGPTLSVPGREATPPETSSTLPPPVTTTTFPMPQEPRRPGDPASFCGFSDYLYSMVSIFINPTVDVAATISVAPRTIAAYRRFTPSDIAPDVALVSETVLGLIDRLESAGFDMSAGPVRSEVSAIVTGDERYRPFLTAYDRVKLKEAATCS